MKITILGGDRLLPSFFSTERQKIKRLQSLKRKKS